MRSLCINPSWLFPSSKPFCRALQCQPYQTLLILECVIFESDEADAMQETWFHETVVTPLMTVLTGKNNNNMRVVLLDCPCYFSQLVQVHLSITVTNIFSQEFILKIFLEVVIKEKF